MPLARFDEMRYSLSVQMQLASFECVSIVRSRCDLNAASGASEFLQDLVCIQGRLARGKRKRLQPPAPLVTTIMPLVLIHGRNAGANIVCYTRTPKAFAKIRFYTNRVTRSS